MADYLTLPLENLHEIPESLADEQAVFVEPLAAAFRIIEQLKPAPADRVLVMGDGKLGLLCALVLKLSCQDVTLMGKHGEKMGLVAGAGIETVARDLVEPAFDLVVEATGSRDGLARALELVRPMGTVVLKSTTAEPARLDLFPIVVNEIKVLGSRCGPFAPAIEALASGRIDVRPLVAACYPVEQAVAAFEHAGRPGALKVLVAFT